MKKKIPNHYFFPPVNFLGQKLMDWCPQINSIYFNPDTKIMQADQYSSVRDELIVEQARKCYFLGRTLRGECTLCNLTVTCTGWLHFLASFSLGSKC